MPWVVATLMSDLLRLSCGITGDPDRALRSCSPDPCLAVQFGGDAFAARRASCPGGPAVESAAALQPHAAGSGISRIESNVVVLPRWDNGPPNIAAGRPAAVVGERGRHGEDLCAAGVVLLRILERCHARSGATILRPVMTTRRLSISAPPVQSYPHLMATMIGHQKSA